jgi:hypothetical protein
MRYIVFNIFVFGMEGSVKSEPFVSTIYYTHKHLIQCRCRPCKFPFEREQREENSKPSDSAQSSVTQMQQVNVQEKMFKVPVPFRRQNCLSARMHSFSKNECVFRELECYVIIRIKTDLIKCMAGR